MNKPKPKDFGYEPANPSFGEEGGWTIEGGEEAYELALEEWRSENPALTSGPWIEIEGFVYGGADGDEKVCFVRDVIFNSANKRLICAAPEMLAELEKCRDFLMFNTGKIAGGSKMVMEIDSIIKKAKGL
jgi:hypothetical protein